MEELSAFEHDDGEVLEKRADESECELLVIEQGELVLGLLAEHVDSVVPWSSPAALPKASPWVLGIIQDRGRLVAVRRPQRPIGPAQRVVLCTTSKGLVGIPATGTRSIGTVRVFGAMAFGKPIHTDQGTLTVLDLEVVVEEMTQS
jgi:chemotaxis signal transduction protein